MIASRVNDPSRRSPGDVNVRKADDPTKWEKVFEVRDKPIRGSDLYAFAQKAIDAGAIEAGVIAVSPKQQPIDPADAIKWAADRGLVLVVFMGWKTFVEQSLFWNNSSALEEAQLIPKLIFDRLIEIEVSKSATELWRKLNKNA